MPVQEVVDRYYHAWQNKAGDSSDVPLAEDFEFTGPVASFDSAEGYRAMARDAGPAVTSFVVRRQFIDGQSVCSVIDWDGDPGRRQAERCRGAGGRERRDRPR
jgi:ketosteroid isomerase-like protein